MKTIIILVIALVLGISTATFVTKDVLATPPPTTGSTEARLQSLEYLYWTEDHAINAVSQRVWDRYSSCTAEYDCYKYDLVLMPFAYVTFQDGSRPTYDVVKYMAGAAATQGQWYAKDNGDGDSFTVTVVINVHYNTETHISWTVWQSNGFIRGVY